VPDHVYTLQIGEAAVVEEGGDVTMVSYGAMLRDTRRAADALAELGVSAEVIDVRTLSPLDHDTIVSSVEKTGRAVVVVEAPRTAALASEIAAVISERALYSLLAPVERVTGLDVVVPLKRTEHYHLPDAARIVAAARRTLEG